MAKRTWITVKRGILEPKHRFALGELIWLFMYILDITNWEEGVIEEWSDKGTAEEMDMPVATLVDQRRKLQDKGYITCERKQHGIRVVVHNWTNPREYTGKKYNEKFPVNTPINTLVNTPINTPVFNDTPTFSHSSYNQKSKVKRQNNINNDGNLFDEFLEIAKPAYVPASIEERRRWTACLLKFRDSGVTPDILRKACQRQGDVTSPEALIPAVTAILREEAQ